MKVQYRTYYGINFSVGSIFEPTEILEHPFVLFSTTLIYAIIGRI